MKEKTMLEETLETMKKNHQETIKQLEEALANVKVYRTALEGLVPVLQETVEYIKGTLANNEYRTSA